MKPVLLSDSHLLAEHREIIRLFKLGKDYWARDYNPDARTMDRTRMLLMLRISKRLSLSLQQPRYMSEPVDAANLVNAMSLDIFGKHITIDTADLSDDDKASI